MAVLSGRYDFHQAKGERYCVEGKVKMMAQRRKAAVSPQYFATVGIELTRVAMLARASWWVRPACLVWKLREGASNCWVRVVG